MEPDSTPVPSPALRLDIAARTHPGRERGNNEDSYLVTSSGAARAGGDEVRLTDPDWVTLAVCDGMGGAKAGEVASRSAVETIDEVMTASGDVDRPSELGHRLVASVQEASRRIHAASIAQREYDGMGTTATVCALRGEDLFVAQVGDSRAYLLRGGRLTRLTRDQTLAALLLEKGQLTPGGLADFQLGHIILQAVGTRDRVDVDLTRVAVRRGDVLLVCSDGLYGPVGDDTIRAVLEDEPTPAAATDTLLRLANEAGGPDNVTCIVARIEGEGLAAGEDEVVTKKATLEAEPAPAPATETEDDEEPLAEIPASEGAGLLRRLRALFWR